MKNPDGSFQASGEEPRLFSTCMFSAYYTEHIPEIMREVQAGYDVDGLFTNGWPAFNRLPVCHCEACRKLPRPESPEYWEVYTERVITLWKMFDRIAKEKGEDNIYFGNMGGGVHATPNLIRLSRVSEWFNCDNQGRGGEGSPIWGASQQGRVATAIMRDRAITNVTGAWSTCGAVRWRNASKSGAEAEIWMDQTVASGMTVWYHWLGAQKGMGNDRRWMKTGRDFMQWLARNDAHFERKRGVATIGVVMGQSSHLFYNPPGEGGMQQFLDGLYYALLEGRFLFDFIHEDDLGPERPEGRSWRPSRRRCTTSAGGAGRYRDWRTSSASNRPGRWRARTGTAFTRRSREGTRSSPASRARNGSQAARFASR
jgi:hypothetical protein